MMIELDEIWKKYGRTDALRGLDLAVPKGSAFALLGANGAGKTTLIRTLMNIIEPDRGRATVMGVDSRRLGPAQLARIGFVSENQRLPERMTGRQFLDYLRPLYPRWDPSLEASFVAQFDLPLTQRIGHLSHGMKMKLRLTAALPFRPDLLVLDEPLSGLDPLMRDDFLAGMLGQAEETTILISSHELHEIEGLATHVGYIDQGRLLFQEEIDDLRGRVREVQVTLDAEARPLAEPPAEWLNIRTVGSVVSFVETRFSDVAIAGKVAAHFGAVRQLNVPAARPASFTALARSLRGTEI
jgi:ABC-2 type transport system ATP-binding protein